MKRPRLSKTITIFRRTLGRALINIVLVKPVLNRFRKSDNLGSGISKPTEVLPTLGADPTASGSVAVTDSTPEQDAPATIPSHQEQDGEDLVDPTLVEEIFAGSSLPAAESIHGDVLGRSDAGEQGAPATASPELTGGPADRRDHARLGGLGGYGGRQHQLRRLDQRGRALRRLRVPRHQPRGRGYAWVR